MIRMQDFGEIAYGGGVTLAEWWDDRRISEGKISEKDIWKKASFYTYLGIGLPATLMSAMNWWPKYAGWAEHLSHGFLYDMPRFIYGIVKNMGSEAGRRSNSNAIRQAQEIARQKARAQTQLTAGRTQRSYQEEFEAVAPYAF